MAQPDLPRSLRRAAARPAGPRGREPSQQLRDAAAAGILSRSNTSPGTAGRRAVDQATYRRRRSVEPELPAREAAGHRVAGSRPKKASFFADDPPRRVTLEGGDLSLTDVRRAGRYMGDVGALLHDLQRDPAHAEQIKRRWEAGARGRAPIAGYELLADADAAIALAEEGREAGEIPRFDSGRSRPGRRRRVTPRPVQRASTTLRQGRASSAGHGRSSSSGRSRSGSRGRSSGLGLGDLLDDIGAGIGQAVDAGADLASNAIDELGETA